MTLPKRPREEIKQAAVFLWPNSLTEGDFPFRLPCFPLTLPLSHAPRPAILPQSYSVDPKLKIVDYLWLALQLEQVVCNKSLGTVVAELIKKWFSCNVHVNLGQAWPSICYLTRPGRWWGNNAVCSRTKPFLNQLNLLKNNTNMIKSLIFAKKNCLILGSSRVCLNFYRNIKITKLCVTVFSVLLLLC